MSIEIDGCLREIFSSAEYVAHLCRPLFKIGIEGFYYMRIYDDNTFIELTTDNPWSRFFCQQLLLERYSYEDLLGHICKNQQFYLWTANEVSPILQDGKHFNYYNGITLYKKFAGFTQTCGFYTSDSSNFALQKLVNNLGMLQSFIDYFTGEIQNLLRQPRKNRQLLPKKYQQAKSTQENPIAGIDVPLAKFFLGEEYNNRYLTHREIMVLQWLIAGKSADEIAVIMTVSKRTVEAHIRNMKEKFNCYKLTQLVHRATILNIHRWYIV